ncbi:Testis-Specific Protein 10-Interacting Protein [Manis pentadactyla]|nr:Testis-Specific Protein 10-Interacting Protein [Manis pentadactyla]
MFAVSSTSVSDRRTEKNSRCTGLDSRISSSMCASRAWRILQATERSGPADAESMYLQTCPAFQGSSERRS